MSTDPAHSLSDSLATPLGAEPTLVDTNLWGQEVRAQAEMEVHWGKVREWLARLLADRGVDRIRAEELTVPPGMDELFALLQIKRHQTTGDFDVVIVDCAPTGETLRLLGFPDIAQWWLEKVFPKERKLLSAARPLARTFDIAIPDPEVLDEVHRLVESLIEMNTILRDGERCSIRLVVNPDRMVINEAQRTFTYLCMYGYLTDAVIVNRILPADVDGTYFDTWRKRQGALLESVRDGFAPVPMLEARYFEEEVIGSEMLDRLGEELFDGSRPEAVLHTGQMRELEVEGEKAILRIPIPFAEKEEIDLKQVGDELVIRVGGEKRTIILPAALAGQSPSGAHFENQTLQITFENVRTPRPRQERI